jgi:hypothetical protein
VARGGDGGPGRLRLREGGRTAVGRRGERRSRWRGEPAVRGGRGVRGRARRGGGSAGRRRRREAAARGGGGAAAETERVRGEKEGGRRSDEVYFPSLPSARDLALDNYFFYF